MKLKDVLKTKGSKVWTIREDQTITEAVETLVSQKIGALLVLGKDEGLVGVISERDIMRGYHQYRGGLDKILVSQLMTRRVIIGSPEDDTSYIMGIMTHNRVRHIPIVAEGKLQGIVSIGDVVKSQLEDSTYEIHYLKEYIYGRGQTPPNP
ncbi:MAG: CBS domain-containing protein [Candidatus Omnitrophica bacterium]|nr:CBS domain-containing protein [Candidatus Omnitrophota bacterium]